MSKATLFNQITPSIARNIIASRFFSTTVRAISSQTPRFPSSDFEKELQKKIEPITQEIHQHRALTHEIFPYLEQRSTEGFTKKQFQIYRQFLL